MTESPDDWRLSFLGDYLVGIAFYRAAYKQPSHDHCMGCWATFLEHDLPGSTHEILHHGYTTDEGPWWICDTCFRDFKDKFGWRVLPDS
ncbi:MAG TPA: hypothetical protein VGN12_25940 [Pirellulales bacterium]|jgi:hypothetical protein